MIYPPGILQIFVDRIEGEYVFLRIRLMHTDSVTCLHDFGTKKVKEGQQYLNGRWELQHD